MGKSNDSYEDMCGKDCAYEQSEVPTYNPPKQNKYEQDLASGKGFNQSGFEGKK